MITKIKLISPVLFSTGEFLNGAELSAPTWVMSGEADVPDARASQLERDGYADIVSVDSAAVVWPSCCSGGDHDHA